MTSNAVLQGDDPSSLTAWHHFKEAQRASASALTDFFEAAEKSIAADAMLVKVRRRSSHETCLTVARGLSRNHALRANEVLGRVDAEVLTTAAPVIVQDLRTDSRTASEAWCALRLRRLVACPMVFADDVVGVLHVFGARPGPLPTSFLREAEQLAHKAASNVVGVRMEYADVRRLVDRAATKAIGNIALRGNDLTETTQALVRALAELIGARRGGVMLLDSGQWLQLMPGGFSASARECASYRVHVDDPCSNAVRVFRTRELHVSNRARGDPRLEQGYIDLFGITRLLSVPLGSPDRPPWGVLHLADKDEDFSADDVHRVVLAAARLAENFELARTTAELNLARKLEGVLSNLAVNVASSSSVRLVVREGLEGVAELLGLDCVSLQLGQDTPMEWRRASMVAGCASEDRFRDALVTGRTGCEVEQPAGPGDPGASWLVVHTMVSGRHLGSLAAYRQRASPFRPSETKILERLNRLANLTWRAEHYRSQELELTRMGERQRIADRLHDHLAQLLFMATANLEAVLDETGSDAPAPLVQAHWQLVEGGKAIRIALEELTGPIDVPLNERLIGMIERVRSDYGLGVEVNLPEIGHSTVSGLDAATGDTLVRLGHEALVNACKHAGPCRLRLALDVPSEDTVRLTVTDDGRGPIGETHPEGYGLSSLRRAIEEQGGTLTVGGRPGEGTRIECVFPIAAAV